MMTKLVWQILCINNLQSLTLCCDMRKFVCAAQIHILPYHGINTNQSLEAKARCYNWPSEVIHLAYIIIAMHLRSRWKIPEEGYINTMN